MNKWKNVVYMLQERMDSMLDLFVFFFALFPFSFAFVHWKDTVHTEWPVSENPAPLLECQTKMSMFRTLSTCGWLQEGRNEHTSSQG